MSTRMWIRLAIAIIVASMAYQRAHHQKALVESGSLEAALHTLTDEPVIRASPVASDTNKVLVLTGTTTNTHFYLLVNNGGKWKASRMGSPEVHDALK